MAFVPRDDWRSLTERGIARPPPVVFTTIAPLVPVLRLGMELLVLRIDYNGSRSSFVGPSCLLLVLVVGCASESWILAVGLDLSFVLVVYPGAESLLHGAPRRGGLRAHGFLLRRGRGYFSSLARAHW